MSATNGRPFRPGDKVVHVGETQGWNYGIVEDLPAFAQKDGKVAVRFDRLVYISPANIEHYDKWVRRAANKQTQAARKDLKNYWLK